jgi:hypothetical protein
MHDRKRHEVEVDSPRPQDALAQLGWCDADRRLVVLRLSDDQWQVFQRAVVCAATGAERIHSTESLLTGCLRRWLAEQE